MREPNGLTVLAVLLLFFFIDAATTEIYTLSLHDALPISSRADHRGRSAARNGGGGRRPRRARSALVGRRAQRRGARRGARASGALRRDGAARPRRSEEHTSELQSRRDLVCRLLLEKKKRY